MINFKLLIFTCLFLLNCKKETHKNTDANNIVKSVSELEVDQELYSIDLNDFLLFIDADEEDFEISNLEQDTILIKKRLYKTLDGSTLKSKKDLKIVTVNEVIYFDLLQYTVDDNPATLLGLNIKKEVNSGQVEEYYFAESKKYSKWVSENHSNEIKKKSINHQKTFFDNLLKEEENYKICCKEYITKAQSFLKADQNYLQSFEDLNTELIITERVIRIKYEENQVIKQKTIIYH